MKEFNTTFAIMDNDNLSFVKDDGQILTYNARDVRKKIDELKREIGHNYSAVPYCEDKQSTGGGLLYK